MLSRRGLCFSSTAHTRTAVMFANVVQKHGTNGHKWRHLCGTRLLRRTRCRPVLHSLTIGPDRTAGSAARQLMGSQGAGEPCSCPVPACCLLLPLRSAPLPLPRSPPLPFLLCVLSSLLLSISLPVSSPLLPSCHRCEHDYGNPLFENISV